MDWLSHINFIELQNLFLAQSPSPSPVASPTADVELLRSQLEFLKQSYSQFVETMKIIFIVLGVAGAVAAFFFGKSYKDFQEFARKDIREFQELARQDIKDFQTISKGEVQNANQRFKEFQELARTDIKDFQEFSRREIQKAVERVQQEAEAQIPRLVEAEVGALIRDEVTNLERTLRREQVISSTLLDYYLPNGTQQPSELKLLQARNFRKIRFRTDLQSIVQSPGDVIILDLKNWVMPSNQIFSELPEADQQQPGKQLVQDLLDIVPESAVIVVYIRGRLFYLNEVSDRYVIPANNPITLVGNVADGAYVVAGDRAIR